MNTINLNVLEKRMVGRIQTDLGTTERAASASSRRVASLIWDAHCHRCEAMAWVAEDAGMDKAALFASMARQAKDKATMVLMSGLEVA